MSAVCWCASLPCWTPNLLNHCKPSKAFLLYTTLATAFYHISRKVTNTDLCYKICGSAKKKEKTDPTNCGDFCADGFGKYNNQNFPRDWCIPIHCSRCFCGSWQGDCDIPLGIHQGLGQGSNDLTAHWWAQTTNSQLIANLTWFWQHEVGVKRDAGL